MVFVLCCFCCLFGLFQLSHEIFSRPSKLISCNEATHTYRRDRLTTNVLRRSVATEEGTFQLITKMFPIGCSGFSLFNFILKITQNAQLFFFYFMIELYFLWMVFVRVCFSSFCFGFFLLLLLFQFALLLLLLLLLLLFLSTYSYLPLASYFQNILSPPVRQAAAILFYPFNVSPPPSIVNHCPFCILQKLA